MKLSSYSSTQPAADLLICRSAKAYLFLVIILPVFAIAPLFYPGYPQTHHGLIPMWNVADLRANLGQPGWLPQVGLHFDPLRSDGLWPYYLASLLPFDPITGVKVVMGLGWLLGSLGMFIWLKGWLGYPGALVAALVYTYLPYHIATVYVRGAWGEAFFAGLLPWAMWATTVLMSQRLNPLITDEATGKPQPTLMPAPQAASRFTFHVSRFTPPFARSFLIVLFWLILGLSHLGLTLWAFMFVVLLSLVLHARQSFWSILVAGLGVALAAIISFTLFMTSSLAASASPAFSSLRFSDHFLYPFQLFSAYWGFGPSRPGWHDGLSFQLGLAATGLACLSLVLFGQSRLSLASRLPEATSRRLIFFCGATVALSLLQFSPAIFLWQAQIFPAGYTLASTLTYPWQLLGLIGLGLASLAGAVLRLDERLTSPSLLSSIIILVMLSSYPYLSPRFIRVDPYIAGPQAQLGQAQLALLAHHFSVLINGNTAGLERSQTAIPLAIHGPLQANDTLQVNVTWQPLQPFAEDFKVFVHLVDANQNILAQFDGQPLAGRYPTSHWIPGELIEDSYPLLFPAAAPPGPYRVFVGLYDEATLTRLPVSAGSEGRVSLDLDEKLKNAEVRH